MGRCPKSICVIHGRIHQTSFGFRNGMETREALYVMQVLIQRARNVDCNTYICFIDFEEAPNNELIEILHNTDQDVKDVRIKINLYMKQTAN